jgi:hypothetical protein
MIEHRNLLVPAGVPFTSEFRGKRALKLRILGRVSVAHERVSLSGIRKPAQKTVFLRMVSRSLRIVFMRRALFSFQSQ